MNSEVSILKHFISTLNTNPDKWLTSLMDNTSSTETSDLKRTTKAAIVFMSSNGWNALAGQINHLTQMAIHFTY